MDLDKLLHISTYAGRLMLQSGAEIYRVEETIYRICKSYGATEADTFATATGIIISITYGNKTVSNVKRIKVRNVDLGKIHLVNALARRIERDKLSLDEFNSELLEIENQKSYPTSVILFFSGLSAACFAVILGGDLRDFIATFFIGIIIKLIVFTFQRKSINEFFINFIGGAVVTFLAITLNHLSLINNIDKTIIGAIMLLVPGLAITNAIRDTIAGDFLAGVTKGAEAFLIALAIASGTGTILSLWINALGGKIS